MCMHGNADADRGSTYDGFMRKILCVAVASLAGCLPPPSIEQGPTSERADDSVRIPPIVRHQLVHGDSVAGIDIAAEPLGAEGWKLHMNNGSDQVASIVWDESSFVTSSGEAVGRLIPGETKRIDLTKSHPPTPLPPHASVNESVFIEKFIDTEEFEGKLPAYDPKYMVDKIVNLRKELSALLIGGKMFVTVSVGSDKKTWSGVVESTDALAPASNTE